MGATGQRDGYANAALVGLILMLTGATILGIAVVTGRLREPELETADAEISDGE